MEFQTGLRLSSCLFFCFVMKVYTLCLSCHYTLKADNLFCCYELTAGRSLPQVSDETYNLGIMLERVNILRLLGMEQLHLGF